MAQVRVRVTGERETSLAGIPNHLAEYSQLALDENLDVPKDGFTISEWGFVDDKWQPVKIFFQYDKVVQHTSVQLVLDGWVTLSGTYGFTLRGGYYEWV